MGVGWVMVISLVIESGKLVSVALKGCGKRGGWVGEEAWGCWVLCPLCMFGYISVIVVEGACIRNCRRLGLCTDGMVDYSVGGEHVRERGSVVTGDSRWR
jgi:hypothetical protein